VLWVVPSDQIYKDTLKALRDRTHFYRESLEFAVGRRIEVWEKQEVARITPGQMASALNVLIVKLQGTNREDRESLKFFRDSGGNIVQHFPAEDDADAQRALLERVSNIEMLEANPNTGVYLAKTSIGNLVRMCEPLVVLDEGHKATSALARQTLEGFNPSLMVELSATPPREANILCRVTGEQLLREEMIKLPINVSNSGEKSWQNCLTQAKDRREALAARALEWHKRGKPLIRPIVLVQVERTGKDQRSTDKIHSEDVREYLTQRLGIPPECVKVKTSDRDDIEGIDLLDDECSVQWIITKSALQEGWDCPYAYILVSLNNTQSKLSMTQLVGRVLRQPFVEKTAFPELNESYVYCLRSRAFEVVQQVRDALQREGYEGCLSSVVDDSGESAVPTGRAASIRPEMLAHYRKPEGKIYLPRFCVKTGGEYSPLDYYSHLLSAVDVRAFDYGAVENWDFSATVRNAKEQYYRIGLNADALEPLDIRDVDSASLDDDNAVRAWLIANMETPWFGAKRLRLIVNEILPRLKRQDAALALIRFDLRERVRAFIQEQTDRQTEQVFSDLFEAGRILFYLECRDCTFAVPTKYVKPIEKALTRTDGRAIQRSLFDEQPAEEFNEYERDVALYLDAHPEVLWWYRNLVGPGNFHIQGYRRDRVYPDFVVQRGKNAVPQPTVLVVETKGSHLEGNADTMYKRNLAEYFERAGRQVSWRELAEGFVNRCFRFQVLDEGDQRDQGWRDALEACLA
jgi:type III restriction enzyme